MTYWKDSLLVGVPQLDTQHRKLVEIIDKLMGECEHGESRGEIEETLNSIIWHTKEHVRTEENLQAKYAYPGISAHKRLHAHFIMNLSALAQEFKQTGSNAVFIGKLNKTLVDWFISHVGDEDKKVGEHILKAGE